MNILTWSYVFLLYILFSRGILFKSYNYLHALVFSIILYLTFDIVNHTREYLIDDKVEVDRTGVEDLVGNLEQQINDGMLKVDINKEIHYSPEEDSTGLAKLCKEKIKDIQKYKEEIKKLTVKINVDVEIEDVVKRLQALIAKLNAKEILLFKKINSLDNVLISKDTLLSRKDNMIYSLNNTISDLSGNIFTLNANLNQKNNKIQNDKETIQLQKEKISNLGLEINNKDKVIQNKKGEITNLTNNLKKINKELDGDIIVISKEDEKIPELGKTVAEKNEAIQKLDNTIKQLNQKIAKNKSTQGNINKEIDTKQSKIDQLQNQINARVQNLDNIKNGPLGKCNKESNQIQKDINNSKFYRMFPAQRGGRGSVAVTRAIINSGANWCKLGISIGFPSNIVFVAVSKKHFPNSADVNPNNDWAVGNGQYGDGNVRTNVLKLQGSEGGCLNERFWWSGRGGASYFKTDNQQWFYVLIDGVWYGPRDYYSINWCPSTSAFNKWFSTSKKVVG